MRARGSAPQPETGTGTASQPGTRPRPATPGPSPAARPQPGERYDHDQGSAHEPGSGLDAWVRRRACTAALLADRQMLIVLDNARDEQQGRPLLPASPASLVLVTSRSQLSGLGAAEGYGA